MRSENGESCLKKIVSLSDLATLLVVSERQVQRLVKQGIIPLAKNKAGQQQRGRFVLGEAVPHYAEHLRDSLLDADPNETAYNKARAERMQSLARLTALEERAKSSEFVRRDVVEFTMTQAVSYLRDSIRAIPHQVSNHVAHVDDAHEVTSILKKAIDQRLHACASLEGFREFCAADQKRAARASRRRR